MSLVRSRVPLLARSLSTFIGTSGREYIPFKIVHSHRDGPERDIYVGKCGGTPYMLKPVPRKIFEFSQQTKSDFKNVSGLRVHVDENEEQSTLVYEYFDNDLLWMIEKNPAIPLRDTKKILVTVGKALCELHAEDWLHLDVKPDNVLLSWHLEGEKEDQFVLDKVVLGDPDAARRIRSNQLYNAKIGGLIWRSPEGQSGRSLNKPSEVFSFGLLCLYVITRTNCFVINYDELKAADVKPEHFVLFILLRLFGPLPDELVTHLHDDPSADVLKELWQEVVEHDFLDPMAKWPDEKLPRLDREGKALLLSMFELDPAKRATMGEVMESPYWDL